MTTLDTATSTTTAADATTKLLLGCGVVAGPLYLVTRFGTVLLYCGAVVGWLWASAVAAKLRSGI